jgi:hypothetical protein
MKKHVVLQGKDGAVFQVCYYDSYLITFFQIEAEFVKAGFTILAMSDTPKKKGNG